MINLPQEVCVVGYHRNIVSGGTASRKICLYSHSTWIWVFVGSGTISLPPVVPYRYFRHSNSGICFHLLSWSIFLRKSGLILWSDSSPNGDWSTNRLDFDHTSWGCRFVPKIANSLPSHFRFTNCLCNFQTFRIQSYFLRQLQNSNTEVHMLWKKNYMWLKQSFDLF